MLRYSMTRIFHKEILIKQKQNTYTAAAIMGTVSCGFHSKLFTVPSTVKIFVHRPVMTSQKRIVLSELPENEKEYILHTNEENK